MDLRGYEFYKTSGAPVSGALAEVWDAVDGTPGGAPITNTNTTTNGKWEFLGLTDVPKDVKVTFSGSIRWYKGLTQPDFTKLFVGTGGVIILGGGLKVAAGNAGIGGAPSGFIGLTVPVTNLTGTSQWGINSQPTGTSAATGDVTAFIAQPGTTAAVFTSSFNAGFRAVNPAKGAGSTITTVYGMLVDSMMAGNTNNYGVYIQIPTGGSGDNFSLVTAGAALLGSSPPGPTFTTGHAYLPLVGGAPSGVPADGNSGNRAPIVIDNVNNKIWVRIGGTWKGVVVA